MKMFTSGKLALATAAVILTIAACSGSYPAKSEKDITDFLRNCGIETAGNVSVKTVTIPAEFGDVYERYNELQKQQGFDLDGYRSREAVVYTFGVASVDGEHTDFTEAHVMVCDDIIIGGDISSPAIDGGMLPLKGR